MGRGEDRELWKRCEGEAELPCEAIALAEE